MASHPLNPYAKEYSPSSSSSINLLQQNPHCVHHNNLLFDPSSHLYVNYMTSTNPLIHSSPTDHHHHLHQTFYYPYSTHPASLIPNFHDINSLPQNLYYPFGHDPHAAASAPQWQQQQQQMMMTYVGSLPFHGNANVATTLVVDKQIIEEVKEKNVVIEEKGQKYQSSSSSSSTTSGMNWKQIKKMKKQQEATASVVGLRNLIVNRRKPSASKTWKPKYLPVVGHDQGSPNKPPTSAAAEDVVKPTSSDYHQLLESIQQHGSKTTVMIKNIPNRYTKGMLLKLLDEHCQKENIDKLESKETTEEEKDLISSAFDFVYLPIDFGTSCNKGYAFVNFTNHTGAWRLYNSLNKYRWELFNSKKICEVTYARIQGKEALIKHFSRSTFTCEKDDFLPVYFNPYRDGSDKLEQSVEEYTVGTRLLPSPSSSSSPFLLFRGNEDEQQRNVNIS